MPGELQDEIRRVWSALSRMPAGADASALEAEAGGLVRALRRRTARANGPDWPEQSWDSYEYSDFELEEWCVSVPFGALVHASNGLVPVAAAERILALPDDDGPALRAWERPAPGRVYRHHWRRSKRFLALAAEIAARFPEDGGGALARALRQQLGRLPPNDRAAVELHAASLGLVDGDPIPLAHQVLEAAASDDLGSRGELVLHALRRADSLPPHQRRLLLDQAAAIARRTTEFVASNPFAACLEALGRNEGGTIAELVEVIRRAALLRLHDWRGWERALRAAGRWVAQLAARGGVAALEQAVAALREYQYYFPGIDALLYLEGARGLPHPDNVDTARRAMEAARRLPPSEQGFRVEVGAARLLAELGAEGGVDELRTTAVRSRVAPLGRAQQTGLQETIVALAGLDAGDGELLAEAVRLAGGLRWSRPRWLAWVSLAAHPAASPELAETGLQQARRASRGYLLRRPPMDLLVPLTMNLAAASPAGLRAAPTARLAALAHEASAGDCFGSEFAGALIGLSRHLTSVEQYLAVADTADLLQGTWWLLPLLALIGDGAAAAMVRAAG
ncbi:MAG: hypothetical protein HYU66_18900 [Armatimonadetes bacterium]|nr:hypothetical protein [Armatimonadota bacterium]